MGQVNLGLSAARQSGNGLSIALVPLGQLLIEDGPGSLACVEALDEGRRPGGAAADVEGPGHDSAVLVGVEPDVVCGHGGDAVLRHGQVLAQQLLAVGLGQRLGELDVSAALGLAQVAVTDGWVAGSIRVCTKTSC